MYFASYCLTSHLKVYKVCVVSTFFNELFVGTALRDLTVLHDEYLICLFCRRDTLGDYDLGTFKVKFPKALLSPDPQPMWYRRG